MTRPEAPDPVARAVGERAVLEDERDILLSALRDLDEERAAGDLTDADYEQLRDDYTRRAARVLYLLDHDGGLETEPLRVRPRRRRGLLLALALAPALIAVAVVALTAAIGDRGTGDTITGNVSAPDPLTEAAAFARNGDLDGAIERYDRILAADPDNVAALTYKGWLQIVGDDPEGIVSLIDAAELDPTFPDVHAFLALAFARLGRTDTALAELDRLESLDPPPELLRLVDDLRAELTTSNSVSTTSKPAR